MNVSWLYTLAKRVKARLTRARPPMPNEWKDIEHFDESWKGRIREMARYVPSNSVVMDLGCGREWLRDYLDNCQYIPVDYRARSPHTVVCDLNKREFPDRQVDVCFVSGCLEYVEDPQWLVREIAAHSKRCVISYCVLDDFPGVQSRAALGWKNNLRKHELVSLFTANGMRVHSEATSMNNAVFCFVRT
jgi:hypothetical protein